MRIGARRILGPGGWSGLNLTQGLLAYWALADNLTDSSGNGRTLTFAGDGTLTFAAGKVGQGVDLEGGVDGPDIFQNLFSSDAGFALSATSLTLAAWIKVETFHANRMYILNKMDSVGGGRGYALRVGGDQILQFLIGSTAAVTTLSWGSTIDAGTWYFVCARFDLAAQLLKLRVNDSADVTVAHTGGLEDESGANLSTSWLGLDFFFDGMLDEIPIYNRALTDAEVAYLFNSNAGRTWPLI